ncbi:hypothetical protein AG1IA_04696 [Rhizoctonia solani AG-1 IA]|uniref:Uncharacterized protein n=1 Tax=Thanatephorus cucumeris (strain AG1-IA) TaxID=983506 RepID=L8WT50_THACA|nr:hypothetical protein AG1IA_04696 [Rhizoctonia solani AG-1 IA]
MRRSQLEPSSEIEDSFFQTSISGIHEFTSSAVEANKARSYYPRERAPIRYFERAAIAAFCDPGTVTRVVHHCEFCDHFMYPIPFGPQLTLACSWTSGTPETCSLGLLSEGRRGSVIKQKERPDVMLGNDLHVRTSISIRTASECINLNF